MKCKNCEKVIDFRDKDYAEYDVYESATGKEYILCGISCLLDWGWRRKETQEKLSKSKALNTSD